MVSARKLSKQEEIAADKATMLHILKTHGPHSASGFAAQYGWTESYTRRTLDRLRADGLVEQGHYGSWKAK